MKAFSKRVLLLKNLVCILIKNVKQLINFLKSDLVLLNLFFLMSLFLVYFLKLSPCRCLALFKPYIDPGLDLFIHFKLLVNHRVELVLVDLKKLVIFFFFFLRKIFLFRLFSLTLKIFVFLKQRIIILLQLLKISLRILLILKIPAALLKRHLILFIRLSLVPNLSYFLTLAAQII